MLQCTAAELSAHTSDLLLQHVKALLATRF